MRLPWLFSLAFLAAGVLAGQSPIRYHVGFPNAVHHEAEVSVQWAGLPEGPLVLKMSRSSPGRYALHEFAKNIYGLEASDGAGTALALERTAPSEWTVAEHDGSVRVTYTLFGDRADGTYVGIDARMAHLNAPASFLWADGLGERPIELRLTPPPDSNWRVATQLEPTDDPFLFRAPNLAYLLDSPVHASDFALREWKAPGPSGSEQTIRLALRHEGSDGEADAFAQVAEVAVAELQGVFGDLPDFDFGTYSFLAVYAPWAFGDGMEHRNSTSLTSTRKLADSADILSGTLVHEFFHAWNVERIRPASLEPFAFDRANMSRELWFAEGFTTYYTWLASRRAGLWSLDRFTDALGGGVDYVLRSNGWDYHSVADMSAQAPFVDAAASNDPNNFRNTFFSYYTGGAVLGLALDLTLRSETDRTLDDFMRAMWREFGVTEKPYTLADLERVLGDVGGPGLARRFFDLHVRGRERPELDKLLARAGLLLRRAEPDKPWIGGPSLRFDDGRATVRTAVPKGSPVYQAGISLGDEILKAGDNVVDSKQAWEKVLEEMETGDSVELTFKQRGIEKTVTVKTEPSPKLEIVLFEETGEPVTQALRAFRADWLSSKAPRAVPRLYKYCPEGGQAHPFDHQYCPTHGDKLLLTRDSEVEKGPR